MNDNSSSAVFLTMRMEDQNLLMQEMGMQRHVLQDSLGSTFPSRPIDIIQQFIPVILPNVIPIPYVPLTLTEEQKSKLKNIGHKDAADSKPRPKKSKHVFRMGSK